jgi:hypothetical protein
MIGCGSTPPPQMPATEEADAVAPEADPAPTEIAGPVQEGGPPAPPPSTASYEEAMSTPEPLDANDTRIHLTDLQLTNPMRNVMGRCRVPRRAKVEAKVAVQLGRAIGVTVHVVFDKPKPHARPPSRAQAKAAAKASKKVADCFDRVIRQVTWPPSSRRDSFTTDF